MKIEILAGGSIKVAFRELGIEATKTYHGSKKEHYPSYQVWEIEKSDLQKMIDVVDWPDNWGWWRSARGSNMGTACDFFTINGKELIAWDGDVREDIQADWDDEPIEEKEAFHYSYKEYEETRMPHKYGSLLEYFCDEIGASQERNVCALAVDLARTNGMSMAQLFQTYEG